MPVNQRCSGAALYVVLMLDLMLVLVRVLMSVLVLVLVRVLVGPRRKEWYCWSD